MANRHLSRSLSLQTLFEWDFNDYNLEQAEEAMDRTILEFGPGLEEADFAQALVKGVISHKEKLDDIITKAAPDWPLSQIANVDRNVLRLGLFELIFGDKKEVPARVAINEAIELAKTFGGENSGRFVNGVLGTIYKEMGEPGKDEVPNKKKRLKNVPYDQMPIEKLGGAVVYGFVEGELKLALVHDIFGFWTLSKGHVKDGEELTEATAREIKEELSLPVVVGAELGSNEYIASDPERGKIRKQVVYFLAEADNPESLALGKNKGGLTEVAWFSLPEVIDLKMYDDIVPIVTKAVKMLKALK